MLYPAGDATPEQSTVILDCDSRYKQCGGACCRLYDVFLTNDEVRSGKYRWDLAVPYRLERQADGSCTYLDLETLKCTIWDDRPHVCRGYSCVPDENIWVDFERRIGTGAVRHLSMGAPAFIAGPMKPPVPAISE